jgi:hypothetical protein
MSKRCTKAIFASPLVTAFGGVLMPDDRMKMGEGRETQAQDMTQGRTVCPHSAVWRFIAMMAGWWMPGRCATK